MENTIKNPYDVLGISKDASEKEIKAAFKKMSIKHHPDRNPDNIDEASKKMAEVNAAYEILKDPKKKANYDNYGNPDGPQGFQGFNGGSGFDGFGDDIFSQFFGGGRRSSYQRVYQPGSDVEATIKLSIKDIYNGGGSRNIKYTKHVRCEKCNGKGADRVETCQHCNGTGRYRQVRNSGFGQMIQETSCPYCGGTGKISSGPKCSNCHGTGFKVKESEIKVNIQPDWCIANGITVRIPNAGSEAKDPSGQNGCVNLTILHDFDSSVYSIDSSGVITQTVEVDYATAILGSKLEIKLPDDSVIRMSLNECTPDGKIYRLSEKGMKVQGHRLPYIIKIKYKIPTSLSSDEKKYLEKITKLSKR